MQTPTDDECDRKLSIFTVQELNYRELNEQTFNFHST